MSRYRLSDERIAEIIKEVEAEQAIVLSPSQSGACCSCCGRMFPKAYGAPTECEQCIKEWN